jgi:hypothetical protein
MEAITSEALEFLVAVGDAVAVHDPGEIGVGDPHISLRVLIDEQPDRPVEAGIWI